MVSHDVWKSGVAASPNRQLTPINASEQYADNVGAYLQDQMKLPYGFQVLAGGRYQYINSRFSTTDSSNFCGIYSTNWANGVTIPCNFGTQTLRGQLVAQASHAALGPAVAPL